MRRPVLFAIALACYLSPAYSAQELKFDCTGRIEHGDVPLKLEPQISGAELKIDLGKRELLLTTIQPMGAIYGKIIQVTDLIIRFQTPDGTSFGGIDRTSGDLMVVEYENGHHILAQMYFAKAATLTDYADLNGDCPTRVTIVFTASFFASGCRSAGSACPAVP
jgi:hypothetical protein